MNGLKLIVACVALVLVAGCGGGAESSAPQPGPIVALPPGPVPTPTPVPPLAPPPPQTLPSAERDISPSLTSGQIAGNLSPHFAVNPNAAVTARGRLFVMLPGTGAVPRFYREVVRTGASRGYHAIGLTYPNDEAVGTLCAANTDPDCAGKARREVILGEDTSPVVSVNSANAIAGRLSALLTFLNATFPNEGWGQFLIGGQPNWALITVAGHSQGGGHAAYMAKLFQLDRTVMFSSPGDVGIAPGSVALWLSLPNITPVSRQYGFTHTADELVPLALVTSNWRTIGLAAFGAPVSVDGAVSPFGNSRQLITSVAPNPNPPSPVPAPMHSSPVVDAVTPLTANGDFLYRPVWIYLAFP